MYKVVRILRGGWTYRVSRLCGTGRGTDIKIRYYNDLVRATAQPDEAPGWSPTRRLCVFSTGDAEPVPDSLGSDVDDCDGHLRRPATGAAPGDPESGHHRGPAGSASRPSRQSGPPARLVIDPSLKRYEET